MKKYLFCTLFPVLFFLSSFSQFSKESETFLYSKIDKLKKSIPTLNGKAKVDCLNTIVDQYQIMDEDNQMQIDSAGPYARQAYVYATKIGYERGLGYASLKLSYIKLLWGQNHKDDIIKNTDKYVDSLNSIQKLIDESMQICKKLNDFTMMGSAYDCLGWLESLKGNKGLQMKYHKEAISYIERQTVQSTNTYKEMNYTNCSECSGQEFRLAELYNNLARLNSNINEMGEVSEALKKAVALYKKAESYPAVLESYAGLISTINTNGNTEGAIQLINEAVSYFKKVGDQNQIGDFYRRVATVIAVRNDTELGTEYFKKALFYYHESGNEQGELSATTMISAGYYTSGNFENSLEFGKKSIQLVEKMIAAQGNKKIKNDEWGKAYYWMARIYAAAGDYETSLGLMRLAYVYYTNNPVPMGIWHSGIGEIYRLKGDYDSSMYHLKQFENNPGNSNGTFYLGRLYISMKQYDNAFPLINRQINASIYGSFGSLGGDYLDLAKIWFGKYDYQRALSNARTAQNLLTRTKRNGRIIDNCQLLSEIFNKFLFTFNIISLQMYVNENKSN